MTFTEKLQRSIQSSRTVLCVGLDPVPSRLPDAIVSKHPDDPAAQISEFCRIVVEATSDFCAAYKPNLAFFEAYGSAGIRAFEEVLAVIPSEKIVIADAKRGDIGNTAAQYRKAYFDNWNCDAVTLSPLMGAETIIPFLDDASRGVYVLALTSNPGATDFMMRSNSGGELLCDSIAGMLAELDSAHPGHAGMVIGATRTDLFRRIMQRHTKGNLLIPGVGSQGGNPSDIKNALDGYEGLPLVNVSRRILYGDPGEKGDIRAGIEARVSHYREFLAGISDLYR